MDTNARELCFGRLIGSNRKEVVHVPLPPLIRQGGTRTVTVISSSSGTDSRADYESVVLNDQGIEKAYFGTETPVYEGDRIEFPDPRGGKFHYIVTRVIINDLPGGPFADMAYTEAHLDKKGPPRVAPIRRLTVENLHPHVIESAGKLFADGHYSRAVTEAFVSLEVRVRGLLDSDNSGTKLMDEAFAGKDPKFSVARHEGRSGEDEQAGFHALFRGAMLGIRNPAAHELAAEQDPQEALEYLALASLLHRRLDSD
ncbi:TIGR02391 family protein [Corynebacterium belfantii]|uniref:TIGR02391 family protein n=1 Tax=Corynebacterium belfantii TaxID=2014537 RepID=UPI000B4B8A53|nr:TIGR02391 family protein [Corynebacterium belfantii]QVI99723.1 TIGR02391 family protein [Corynebacterium diphtheriae]MBG9260131.1 TIGR02391 family protein [Corynebacterium belfantii]MBG9266880.1 TIGR02391 family protein [Corynebacterium belfantii]MBG9307346.1 TIGR02391 family protein [Corynebacterium belfantii]SNW32880.1 Protein of unknown function (Hypoth_ymh) [Corynebacterium belfantii]